MDDIASQWDFDASESVHLAANVNVDCSLDFQPPECLLWLSLRLLCDTGYYHLSYVAKSARLSSLINL